MLRKIRTILACLFFAAITLLFLDFTGTIHLYLGWLAKIQFLPAVLALNVGVVLALVVLTLLVGRVYCSVICPMGVMQDCFSWLGAKAKKNRFHYAKNHWILRVVVLVVFVLLMVLGLNGIAILIAPYSAYGRIATNLFQPVYMWINNLCAFFAERADSYAFYSVDVWVKSGLLLLIAAVTFVVIGFLSFRWGRLWCNTICPVGTVLGFFSKFALLKPRIDQDKCISCKKCEKNCKSMCIDIDNHKVDYSRCVACMDCIDNCPVKAIRLAAGKKGVSASCSACWCREGARCRLQPPQICCDHSCCGRSHVASGTGDEGRRWSCRFRRQAAARSSGAPETIRSSQPQTFLQPLYRLSALRVGMS